MNRFFSKNPTVTHAARESANVRLVTADHVSLAVFVFVLITLGMSHIANAQSQDNGGWQTDLDVGVPFPTAPNTTIIPRTKTNPDKKPQPATQQLNDPVRLAQVKLMAFLTADGQRIDRGLTWRVYAEKDAGAGRNQLLMVKRTANPIVNLKPGSYIVNAAFGRAHLTRKFTVKSTTEEMTERFVINAGGLRVKPVVDGASPAYNSVKYDIYEGERNQSGDRELILSDARPNLIIRLNAGIYHIVSTYGDANAKVAADITVEAGKLSEATITHTAARVTFKLVNRAGGEALPGTQWTVKSPEGEVVKESIGALPTHILAPGSYTLIGRAGGKEFQRSFQVVSGESTEVELLIQ